ncbi:uncharacterized protein ARMOST_17009 [Armillaria ostoyae]|uniref:Fe2OG dioxygenase domain-containing protein n=1 Tax=Armillaria ostoyae TaxID=47428 RepID=A0A284RXU2_ARMOS|nr:uncharacterized protein ARMOST_17009 [Armillaria ostoyae]
MSYQSMHATLNHTSAPAAGRRRPTTFPEAFSKAMSYFMLSGNYACSETFRQTPTPNLVIDGIGPISLPLSTRDARLIISNASRAPYGHNQETIVNTNVRDTWEINASRITLRPGWQAFIEGTVLPSVLQKLGMQVTAPRCELYKLLLYQEGSHFARHQDTARTSGMFATIVIILPSRYEGGEVEVSHAGSSRPLTFDFASQSQSSTTVLAWYSDVHHEIKRVTSGYRLVLTYNVIRPPSRGAEPLPSPPDVLTIAVNNLRTILHRWAELPTNRRRTFFAYMLSYQYSIDDLEDSGIEALKGSDKHKVGYARDIAEQLGYVLRLASIKYHELGAPGIGALADEVHRYKRRRGEDFEYASRRDDRLDDEVPEMDEIILTSMEVDNVVDLEGESVSEHFDMRAEDLVPSRPSQGANPVQGMKPDETEYEGYMGNYGAELNYYYHRTVLIFVHDVPG